MPPAPPPTSPFGPDDDGPSSRGDADVLARAIRVPMARPMESAEAGSHEPMLLMELTRSECAGQLFLILGLFLALNMLAGSVIFTIVGEGTDVLSRIGLPLTAAIGLLVSALTVLLFRRRELSVAALGIKSKEGWADVALGLLATVGAFGAFFLSVGVMYLLWPSGFSQMTENPKRITEFVSPTYSLGTLFVMMLIVGVYEEFLFRGVLLTHVRRLTGSWFWAVVISSVVFGASHAGMQVASAMVPLSAVGVVFAVLTVYRRSLVPAIIGHGIFNWLQLVAMRMYGPTAAESDPAAAAATVIIRWLASDGGCC